MSALPTSFALPITGGPAVSNPSQAGAVISQNPSSIVTQYSDGTAGSPSETLAAVFAGVNQLVDTVGNQNNRIASQAISAGIPQAGLKVSVPSQLGVPTHAISGSTTASLSGSSIMLLLGCGLVILFLLKK